MDQGPADRAVPCLRIVDGGQDAPALGERPLIDPTATIRDSRLDGFTEVGARSTIVETELGAYSCVADDARIVCARIGRFCTLGARSCINPRNHPTSRATLHPFIYDSRRYGLGDDDAAFLDWCRAQPVVLGHDVSIGHGAIVLPGVRIGTGAVVGAGAVVTESVLPFTIVAGVPARPLRRRFDKATAQALLDLAWWDWPRARLAAALHDFRTLDAKAFVAKYRHLGRDLRTTEPD